MEQISLFRNLRSNKLCYQQNSKTKMFTLIIDNCLLPTAN